MKTFKVVWNSDSATPLIGIISQGHATDGSIKCWLSINIIITYCIMLIREILIFTYDTIQCCFIPPGLEKCCLYCIRYLQASMTKKTNFFSLFKVNANTEVHLSIIRSTKFAVTFFSF